MGVASAVERVVALRDEGLGWVARTDVRNCFPRIPRERVRVYIRAAHMDEDLEDLTLRLLDRHPSTSTEADRGLPQGSALSPLFTNLVLGDVDAYILSQGFQLVRYADDLVVAASSQPEGWEAMRVASDAVERVEMDTGPAKSEVVSFEDGFCFLGQDFGPSFPPSAVAGRPEVPDRKVLYAGMQGSTLSIRDGRLRVRTPTNQVILDVPQEEVSRIVCAGAVGVSSGLRSWALSHDVETVLLSKRGNYLGVTTSATARVRADRLRRQLEVGADPQRRLDICRSIVTSKLDQQIALLQTLVRRDSPIETAMTAVASIQGLLPFVAAATTVDEALGFEGAAASAYFTALGALMPPDLQFTSRSKRPPRDVPNAAMSYGYALLLGECVGALHAAGLDPAFGVMHAEQDTRPSLALDLMEPFRPLVVDHVVASLCRRRELRPAFGTPEQGPNGQEGIYLTRAGKTALVAAYENRMLKAAIGVLTGFQGTLRRALLRQAEMLARTVLDDTGRTNLGPVQWRP